ncbi:hydantoinase/oxoprolinase family protein [Sporomusa sphaeroides]|uniref:Acetophenone carboxylase gamma subunit n=1 Tax=Sporomusa sphaeroides DSM 2875 TaxID=1337886 RepID=A0ABM9VYW6_9FIRM|nr:hydantoinase/oxoprolinase family protein [Sporomusa sphaeroides]OLS57359.1 acetophenone carboxylase gamma subunit [Sporomusa sphaeroides DSM 2875]CVK18082.1 Acetophenone carboxylase gamma subunit [Sporomusa sphaeroides DSM 2875]
MSLVLGIDTGGTYTDGVVVERKSKQILTKAKALTTREDLSIGIRNCIANLDFEDFKNISAVSLSTTLATNAIVEGRGCEVGLLMIGCNPIDSLPVKHYYVLPGGHNLKGRPNAELDLAKTRQAICELKGKVDAVAISGYLSVRNPEHEIAVMRLVTEILDLPVVCAHQLTTSLGFHERTVTAALNARLIPIITELIESVKKVLDERGIDAPIMVVKGDGCMMGEALAREKPIETILSGPASSIIGGTFLTQCDNALVLDMGGTTTDIAILQNGVPKINQEGATVGGWLTRVQAAQIYTYGLGGDSYIQVSRDGAIQVGPQRVWPLCVIGYQYPYLIDELKLNFDKTYDLMFAQATDCFMFLKRFTAEVLSDQEKEVVKILQAGPHSLHYLTQRMDIDPNLLNLQHLVDLGILARVSLTPTDILHASGIYDQWNREAAKLGVEILATRTKESSEEFIRRASEQIVNDLCITCLQSLIGCEGQSMRIKSTPHIMYFMQKALSPERDQSFDCSFTINMPVIGIGAPVRAWLPAMAEKMNTGLIIPEHAEVANAVGAATGKIMETVKVLIKPGEKDGTYLLHASWECKLFENLAAAVLYAMAKAKEQAALAASKAGAKEFELVVNHQDKYAQSGMTEKDLYIESLIEITAVERPEWEREEIKEKFFVDCI